MPSYKEDLQFEAIISSITSTESLPGINPSRLLGEAKAEQGPGT